MAKKRTKKDKVKTKQRRVAGIQVDRVVDTKSGEVVYKLETVDEKSGVKLGRQDRKAVQVVSLLGYDEGLVVKDLLKTVVLSGVILSALVGMYGLLG